MGRLDGKVAVVTGAGTGIGKAIARGFAREGATLVVASRTKEKLDATAAELRAHGATVLVKTADVTDEGQVMALFDAMIDEFGQVDILVNNSGVFDGGPLEEITLETWRHVLDVNITGVFLCTREAMKIMKRQGGGRIINIGSISAQAPRPDSAPYATTKHALVGLTRATALEGRGHGVVASVLHPGNVLTERRSASDAGQDQEPMMTPDELATAAVAVAALPLHVNMTESIVLPVQQLYLGRG